jgi:periplasmic protein CpxP/Spy
METVKNSKVLSIAVIGLIITNVGLLCFLFFAGPKHGPHAGGPPMHPPPHGMHGMGHPEGPPQDHLSQELNFSAEQKAAMEKLRDAHHKTMKDLLDKSHEYRQNIFNQLAAADDAKVVPLADSVAAVQKQIELATFNHFKEVRKLCDEKQAQRFDEVIGGVLQMMGRGGH